MVTGYALVLDVLISIYLISYIAKADTAYSVSLTTVSTLLCPLLTPGLTFILAGSRLEVPFLQMAGTVVKMVVVPLFIGFGARYCLKEKIEKILPVFPAISATFIMFICIITASLMAAVWQRATANEASG